MLTQFNDEVAYETHVTYLHKILIVNENKSATLFYTYTLHGMVLIDR